MITSDDAVPPLDGHRSITSVSTCVIALHVHLFFSGSSLTHSDVHISLYKLLGKK